MTKEQIARKLQELNDDSPFIGIATIMKVTKMGHGKCRDLVDGLDTMAGPRHGNIVTQLYFVDDVAQRIMERGLI